MEIVSISAAQLKIKKTLMKENKKRGHIKSYSKFDLNENTFLDLQIERSTINYLNTYRLCQRIF